MRKAVRIPVLRKDFMVDDYQLFEARAHGADLILLIVAALAQDDLVRMHGLAHDLGMTALVEVHDEDETRRAVDAGASVIGVNARNLKTLAVDPDTFARLAPLIPDSCVKVAESGRRRTRRRGPVRGRGRRRRPGRARRWCAAATRAARHTNSSRREPPHDRPDPRTPRPARAASATSAAATCPRR